MTILRPYSGYTIFVVSSYNLTILSDYTILGDESSFEVRAAAASEDEEEADKYTCDISEDNDYEEGLRFCIVQYY